MNSRTEHQLDNVYLALIKYTGSVDDSERILAPLQWYITTGRCTGEFIRLFNNLGVRQTTTIAKRLLKFGGNDYESAIESVKAYVFFR